MEDLDHQKNLRKKAEKENRKDILQKVLVLAFVIILTIVIYRFVKPDDIRDLILSSGAWGQLIYVICWIFLPMGFFPVGILAVIGGMGFGFIRGSILTFIGAAFNLMFMFYISRYLFRGPIQRWLKHKYPAILSIAQNDRRLKQFLIFARIVPVIPYTVENYVFGLTSINAWEYLYLSLIFILPGTFIYVNIGDKSLDVSSPGFITAVVLLVLISVVPIGVERWRNKKKKDKAEINEEEKNT